MSDVIRPMTFDELVAEIDRLRAKNAELEAKLHPKCSCSRCTGIPDFEDDLKAAEAAKGAE